MFSINFEDYVDVSFLNTGTKTDLIGVLHPIQLSCFFANFIMPLFDGVEIETDRVWLP